MYAAPHGTRWYLSCPQMLYSWRVGGCLRGGALRLQQDWGHLEGLLTQRWLGPAPELLIRGGGGARACISNQVPGDPDAAGLWEPLP